MTSAGHGNLIMKTRSWTFVLICLTVAIAACGGKEEPTPQPPPPAAAAPPAPPPAMPAPPAMPRSTAPAGAKVSITSPADGAKVQSPVKVQFTLEGMEIAPAGTLQPNTGHHHLLVDTPLPEDMGQPILKDDQHLHYGLSQTEAEVTLSPGSHTLQALLGDGNHVPHDPPVVSEPITITVE
jgi:hypothetical protein